MVARFCWPSGSYSLFDEPGLLQIAFFLSLITIKIDYHILHYLGGLRRNGASLRENTKNKNRIGLVCHKPVLQIRHYENKFARWGRLSANACKRKEYT